MEELVCYEFVLAFMDERIDQEGRTDRFLESSRMTTLKRFPAAENDWRSSVASLLC